MRVPIFSLIFFGYGLGLFGRLGACVTLMLGIAVFAAQCAFSALWLRRYRYTWAALAIALQLLTLAFGRDPNGSGAALWFTVGPVSMIVAPWPLLMVTA